ncbi:MAG TPA: hypothetical protein VN853_15055 [Polyangia bacterium]|nr:hypothetical protein [Polyangia bacterium]
MRHNLVRFLVGSSLFALGCATPGNSGGGTGGGNGGSTSSGSGGSSQATGNGGSGPGTGNGGSGPSTGSGGSGPVTCGNSDMSIVPIDSTGWDPGSCNEYGIQGAWYCYTDGMTQTNCTTGTPPWNTSSGGMCLSGTSLGAVANTYGAAIGISLNDSGGTPDVKGSYDATAHNIIGFEVTITGSFSPLDLRFGFKDSSGADVAPFYAIIGPGTYQILFSQASVPASWMVTNAGAMVMPTSLTDLQFQIAGDEKAGVDFNFCITSLKPILSSGSTGTGGSGGGTGGSGGNSCGTLTAFGGGASKCGTTDVITGVGNYAVQNDLYNAMGGTQCVTATSGGGCAGFTATPTLNVSGGTPGSYPSIVYGWHYHNVYGPYTSPKQISAINSVPSSWQFTVPTGNVKYDVSYDIWINQSGGNPTQPDGNTLELMVWLDETSNVVPAGSKVTTATIAGTTWNVYTGMVSTWHYIAYQRSASTAPFNNVDLKAFMTDAATRNVGATTSWYLLSVEAGFEIWQGSSSTPFVTNAYEVSVN